MVGVKSLIGVSHGDVGISRRAVSQNGLVFSAPLWHPALQGASFCSLDHYRHLVTVTGATWPGILDGTDDYYTVPHNAILNAVGSRTIEAWIKAPALTGGRTNLVFKRLTVSAHPYEFRIAGTDDPVGERQKLNFNIWDGTNNPVIKGTAVVADNTWHHVVAIRGSQAFLYLYVDGVSDATPVADTATGSTANTDDLYIGSRQVVGSTNYFKGTIGEARIYNCALSAAEVLNNYGATKWRYQ